MAGEFVVNEETFWDANTNHLTKLNACEIVNVRENNAEGDRNSLLAKVFPLCLLIFL